MTEAPGQIILAHNQGRLDQPALRAMLPVDRLLRKLAVRLLVHLQPDLRAVMVGLPSRKVVLGVAVVPVVLQDLVRLAAPLLVRVAMVPVQVVGAPTEAVAQRAAPARVPLTLLVDKELADQARVLAGVPEQLLPPER